MKLYIPENTKKAKVEISFGENITKSCISIDGKTLPYKKLLIYQSIDKTYVFLERNCDSHGNCTEELYANSIEEYIEASPLIVNPR